MFELIATGALSGFFGFAIGVCLGIRDCRNITRTATGDLRKQVINLKAQVEQMQWEEP